MNKPKLTRGTARSQASDYARALVNDLRTLNREMAGEVGPGAVEDADDLEAYLDGAVRDIEDRAAILMFESLEERFDIIADQPRRMKRGAGF